MDLKQPTIHVQPVTLDTPDSTPATTPDQNSPSEEDVMAGKKIFSMRRPDDRAKDLAAQLTLEEQVGSFQSSSENARITSQGKHAHGSCGSIR